MSDSGAVGNDRNGRIDHVAVLDRVLALTVMMGEDMSSGLAREGLTVSRTHLLWELRQRGPSTQRVLADALRVSARNVTGLVDALVETGFVTREPHPDDRRATLVSFTERGAEVIVTMEREQRELAAALFSRMPDEDLRAFVSGLDATIGRLGELMAEVARQAGRETGRSGGTA